MKIKWTWSQIKIYLMFIGLCLISLYHVFGDHNQAAAATVFATAIGLLGIGNQTAATRQFVDPNLASSPVSEFASRHC